MSILQKNRLCWLKSAADTLEFIQFWNSAQRGSSDTGDSGDRVINPGQQQRS